MKYLIYFLLFNLPVLNSIAQDSLSLKFKAKVLSETQHRNEAYKTNDLKTIYKYTYKLDLKGISLSEFQKENQKTIDAMKSDRIEIDYFKIDGLKKIVVCENEIQCLIKQETFMTMPGEKFSFKTNLIAISNDNGKNWTFINGAETKYADLVKFYPNLCESLYIND